MKLISFALIFIFSLFSVDSSAHMNEGSGGMMGYHGWGMGGFGGPFMVIFWVIVIIVIVLLAKLILGGTKKEGKSETALDILKKRYANGEIDREEFDSIKKDLE